LECGDSSPLSLQRRLCPRKQRKPLSLGGAFAREKKKAAMNRRTPKKAEGE
jgi:hypothetical protein